MKRLLATSLLAIFLLVSCSVKNDTYYNHTSNSQIKMAGSTTLDPIMNLLIETYKEVNPSLSLSYEALGSSVGIKNLETGTVEIAGSSRNLKQSELEAGLIPHAIGFDGLAVIINAKTGIKNLSKVQLKEVFEGKIKNWKEVGGKDLPVIIIKRDEASGTYTSFKELALNGDKYAREGLVVNSNGDAVSKVANTFGSISYIGMSYIAEIDRSRVNILSIEDISPNRKMILSKKYPLSREVYLVTKKDNNKKTIQNLLDFILSKEGQELVEEAGFFPLPKDN